MIKNLKLEIKNFNKFMVDEEQLEIPKKFEKLVSEIESMSVLDLAELVKILEKKFGVSSAPAMMAMPAGGGVGALVVEEKASFNVVLTAIGDKKIDVIKTLRDITQLGLKESKDMVDAAVSTPQTVKENVKKEEAEEIKKKFMAVGATIELK